MSDEQDRRALKWRREKWRRQWIARFAERHRIARRWIALVDLVDWCAQSTTTASRDEEAKAREVAYQRLTGSVRKGELERDGRSKILYLDTLVTSDGWSPRCRLSREQFEIALNVAATPPAPSLPFPVLNCCWLPRELARRWLESHGYRSAPHFEPAPAKLAPGPTADFEKHGFGKGEHLDGGAFERVFARAFGGSAVPPVANVGEGPAPPAGMRTKRRPPSQEKKFWPAAREAAVEWLTDNGCPAPGDGYQRSWKGA
jgi:hypothetical protein